MTTNSYSDDVKHFDSDQWWDTEGKYHVLHKVNPLRLNFVCSHAAVRGKTVLDAGCGGGLLSSALARLGAQVTGIDLADKSLQSARSYAQQHELDIDYRHASPEELVGETFDIVCCMEMLEHVPDPQAMIQSLAKICRQHLFVSTINRNLLAWLGVIVAAEKVLRWLPAGTHNASRFITPDELRRWAAVASFEHVDTRGMIFDPLTMQFRLHSNTAINYLQAYTKNNEPHQEGDIF